MVSHCSAARGRLVARDLVCAAQTSDATGSYPALMTRYGSQRLLILNQYRGIDSISPGRISREGGIAGEQAGY
jgi:hypothetical protein